MYACMYVYIYIYIYVYTHTHTLPPQMPPPRSGVFGPPQNALGSHRLQPVALGRTKNGG